MSIRIRIDLSGSTFTRVTCTTSETARFDFDSCASFDL